MNEFEQQVAEALTTALNNAGRAIEPDGRGSAGELPGWNWAEQCAAHIAPQVAAAIIAADQVHDDPDPAASQEAALAALRARPPETPDP